MTAAAYGDGGGVLDIDWLDGFATGLLHAVGTSEERPWSHLLKLAVLAVVLGFIAMLLRRRWLAAMLSLPFVLTLLASRLELYPITERTTLFLVPLVALLLAEGVSAPTQWIRGRAGPIAQRRSRRRRARLSPLWAAEHLVRPPRKQELRPVLEEVRSQAQPGDALFLHPASQYAFRYYADCECLASAEELSRRFPFDRSTVEPTTRRRSVPSRRDSSSAPGATGRQLRRRLDGVNGRLWVIFSHVRGPDEQRFVEVTLPTVLDDLGERRAVVRRPGATAYLYGLP